jgi:hypothetical protein
MTKNNPHGLAYDRYLDPPDDDELPECERCDGTGGIKCYCLTGHKCGWAGIVECPDCNGTGYQPDDRDGFDADDTPYEGP